LKLIAYKNNPVFVIGSEYRMCPHQPRKLLLLYPDICILNTDAKGSLIITEMLIKSWRLITRNCVINIRRYLEPFGCCFCLTTAWLGCCCCSPRC